MVRTDALKGHVAYVSDERMAYVGASIDVTSRVNPRNPLPGSVYHLAVIFGEDGMEPSEVYLNRDGHVDFTSRTVRELRSGVPDDPRGPPVWPQDFLLMLDALGFSRESYLSLVEEGLSMIC